jgi:VanZ family protein
MKLSKLTWRRRITAYAPLFVWIGLIFFLSSSLGSFNETSSLIGPILRFVFPDASPELIRQYHGLIRKGAHVFMYAGLGFLTFRTFWLGRSTPGKSMVMTILLFVTLIASLDELHQSFLSSRTGTPWDVVLDFLGGVLGLIAGSMAYGFWKANVRSPPVGSAPE